MKMKTLPNSSAWAFLRITLFLCAICFGAAGLHAADHRDGPRISVDAAADIGDLYIFLDPNDNTRAVLSMTVGGFMIPGEAVNQAIFDPSVRYQFQVEGT